MAVTRWPLRTGDHWQSHPARHARAPEPLRALRRSIPRWWAPSRRTSWRRSQAGSRAWRALGPQEPCAPGSRPQAKGLPLASSPAREGRRSRAGAPPKDREARLAQGLQHQLLIRPRGHPCRPRIAVDPARAPRGRGVQTEIKSQGQLVYAFGHKHLAGCQPKTPRLLEQSRARHKPESLAVVARADLAQTAIAREDLLATHCGHDDLPGYGVAIVGDHAMPVQPGSELVSSWLEPFRSCFTGPTFRHVLVLVTGAIL